MQHISWSQGQLYSTPTSFLSTGVFSWGSSLIIKYYLFSEVVQYTVQSIILLITLLLCSLPFHPWQSSRPQPLPSPPYLVAEPILFAYNTCKQTLKQVLQSDLFVTNFIRPYLHQFFDYSHGLNGYGKPLKRPFDWYQSCLEAISIGRDIRQINW